MTEPGHIRSGCIFIGVFAALGFILFMIAQPLDRGDDNLAAGEPMALVDNGAMAAEPEAEPTAAAVEPREPEETVPDPAPDTDANLDIGELEAAADQLEAEAEQTEAEADALASGE